MATIKELNEAIETLKVECESHKECTECPMFDNCDIEYGYVQQTPCNWETIKDGDYDEAD